MDLTIIVLVLIGLAMYYGLFQSVETAARMANRKVDRLEAEQIKGDVEYYSDAELISEEKYTAALANKKLIAKFIDL